MREMTEQSRKDGKLGFSSVWIPVMVLLPASSVRVPAAMCVLLRFKYSGQQQREKRLDGTCRPSFSWRILARVVEAVHIRAR